jgi:putative tryptophan/tyrosine transport system substrate-binding protein
VPRVGILAFYRSPAMEAFVQGMRELGYVEGQNVVYDWRLAEGDAARLPPMAAELVELRVDVIFAPVRQYAVAARRATDRIPIVFSQIGNAVELGLIESVRRPGGNVTGLAGVTADTGGKRLELLHLAVQAATRVGYIWDATVSSTNPQFADAAPRLGLQLVNVPVQGSADLERGFEALAAAGVQAVLVAGNPLFYNERQRVANFLAAHRLPAISVVRELTELGALMSYGEDVNERNRLAASYVDRILKGERPAQMPVEEASTYELVVNLRTARTLSLDLPEAVLLQTAEIIQ